MSSADYWKKREQEAKKATIRDEEEYRKRIETIYKQTYEAVERQINDWYARYASKNGLSMSEARMRVKKLDMERYERLAAKYVATHDFSDQANEEMEIYNLTMRINRLELLKAQINLELLAGYDDLDKELEREFIEQAMKEDRRLAGILGDSVIGNQRYAKQIVNASFWNATYSERIWGNNMPRLRSSIETQLRNGIIQGIHSTELARNLRKSFDVSIRDSERLMITEVRRIQTEIQKDSFDRNGFREYRFISAGDGKVCPECERLHGQHFKVSEMQPGENAPPMHPVCRCSTAAWMDGEKYKRWLDALERGEDVRWKEFEPGRETPQAPGGLKLTEQQKLRGKMERNRGKDKEQYQRYRKVLGDMVPDSLDSFQKMKYNNTSKWNSMKHNYRIVNSYEVNAGSMTPGEILQLDELAFTTKRQLFTGKAKNKANIAVMQIDGKVVFGNSQVNYATDPYYTNFQGDKSQIALKVEPPRFKTVPVGRCQRPADQDSEAKLFEYASVIADDGQKHNLYMLSERCMCKSCRGVLKQFEQAYPNVELKIVSGREDRVPQNKNNPWKYRK